MSYSGQEISWLKLTFFIPDRGVFCFVCFVLFCNEGSPQCWQSGVTWCPTISVETELQAGGEPWIWLEGKKCPFQWALKVPLGYCPALSPAVLKNQRPCCWLIPAFHRGFQGRILQGPLSDTLHLDQTNHHWNLGFLNQFKSSPSMSVQSAWIHPFRSFYHSFKCNWKKNSYFNVNIFKAKITVEFTHNFRQCFR